MKLFKTFIAGAFSSEGSEAFMDGSPLWLALIAHLLSIALMWSVIQDEVQEEQKTNG